MSLDSYTAGDLFVVRTRWGRRSPSHYEFGLARRERIVGCQRFRTGFFPLLFRESKVYPVHIDAASGDHDRRWLFGGQRIASRYYQAYRVIPGRANATLLIEPVMA
jgi:hypothetical protein